MGRDNTTFERARRDRARLRIEIARLVWIVSGTALLAAFSYAAGLESRSAVLQTPANAEAATPVEFERLLLEMQR